MFSQILQFLLLSGWYEVSNGGHVLTSWTFSQSHSFVRFLRSHTLCLCILYFQKAYYPLSSNLWAGTIFSSLKWNWIQLLNVQCIFFCPWMYRLGCLSVFLLIKIPSHFNPHRLCRTFSHTHHYIYVKKKLLLLAIEKRVLCRLLCQQLIHCLLYQIILLPLYFHT